MSVERKARRMREQAESKARVQGWKRRKAFKREGERWMALGRLRP